MKNLADLPNQVGFSFTGVLKDGTTKTCVVEQRQVKGADGKYYPIHTVKDYENLVGWFN
jgi:hypothetical protein